MHQLYVRDLGWILPIRCALGILRVLESGLRLLLPGPGRLLILGGVGGWSGQRRGEGGRGGRGYCGKLFHCYSPISTSAACSVAVPWDVWTRMWVACEVRSTQPTSGSRHPT